MRLLFGGALATLAAIALAVLKASVPTVPPPCEITLSYSTWPSFATVGAAFWFWVGGRMVHRPVSAQARAHPKGVPVYLTLTAALFLTAMLLGYEVYAVVSGTRPDVTITHYVRCAYASTDVLLSAATVAGAWAVCLILGHWFSYR